MVFEDDFEEIKDKMTDEIQDYFEYLNSLNFCLKSLKQRDETTCTQSGSE